MNEYHRVACLSTHCVDNLKICYLGAYKSHRIASRRSKVLKYMYARFVRGSEQVLLFCLIHFSVWNAYTYMPLLLVYQCLIMKYWSLRYISCCKLTLAIWRALVGLLTLTTALFCSPCQTYCRRHIVMIDFTECETMTLSNADYCNADHSTWPSWPLDGQWDQWPSSDPMWPLWLKLSLCVFNRNNVVRLYNIGHGGTRYCNKKPSCR